MSNDQSEEPREWRPVAPEGARKAPLPPAVKYGGLGLLALLIVAAVVIGIALGGGFTPEEPTPTPTPKPALLMDPPVQVGDFVRGELTTSEGPAPANQRIVRADYSDGTNKLVLLLTFPESDVADFLAAAGIEHPEGGVIELLEGVSCGVSADTTLPACGKVVDGTGILIVSLTDAEVGDVRERLNDFTTALTP
ncbi:MAG: hypothetical protein IPJ61_14215 [Tessaracoccus sp.]|uniref:hypothetical protein n=1 Tax=Tessaracoccus sp. TaxID=1971211 RepID=UPI001EC40319|nr:hypothetical protein [Tessaracoccus sp.]MBK7822173.1 hypothetical protein [Tessaracoccus sp.]